MYVLPYLHLLASFSVHILKWYLFVVKLVMLLGCNNLLSISVDQVMPRGARIYAKISGLLCEHVIMI